MEPLKESLREFSKKFGEVHAFASHRVVEYHHWAIARNGNVSRSFSYCGDKGELWDDEGTKIAVEPNFHLDPGDDKYNPSDEALVMEIAGACGINPQRLGEEPFSNRLGVLGSIKAIGSTQQQPVVSKGFVARILNKFFVTKTDSKR